MPRLTDKAAERISELEKRLKAAEDERDELRAWKKARQGRLGTPGGWFIGGVFAVVVWNTFSAATGYELSRHVCLSCVLR